MRPFIRRAFVALLAVALGASGSVLRTSSHAASHGHAEHAHHASHDGASGGPLVKHEHAQHETSAQDNGDDHASKTCCSMCTVASPLPHGPSAIPVLEVSLAQYLSQSKFGIALTVPIDPGIPKRIG
jgi:hypothetical protein